jgi:hypothetical protein
LPKWCAGWGRIFIVLVGALGRGMNPDPNPVFRGNFARISEWEMEVPQYLSKNPDTHNRIHERDQPLWWMNNQISVIH